MSGDAHGRHAEEGHDEEGHANGEEKEDKKKYQAKVPTVESFDLLPSSFFQLTHSIRLEPPASGKKNSKAFVNDVLAARLVPGHKKYDAEFPAFGRYSENHVVLARVVEELVNSAKHAETREEIARVLGHPSKGNPFNWHGDLRPFFKHLDSQASLMERNGYNPNNPWHRVLNLIPKHSKAWDEPQKPHAADPGANTPGSQKPGKAPGSQKGQRPAFPGGLPYGAMPGPYGFPPHFDPSMPYGMPHPSSLGPHAGPSMFPGMNPDYFSPYGSASGNPSAAHNPFAGPAHPYGAARLPEHFDPGQVGFFPGVPGMPIAHAGAGAFASGVSPHYAWFSPHLTHLPPEHWAQLGLHQFMPGSMPPLQPYGPTHQIHFNPATGWSMAAPVSEPQTAHSAELMRVLSHRDVFKSKEARASIGRELDALKQEGHLPGLNPFGFGKNHLGGTFEEALRKNEAPLADVIRTLSHPAMPAGVAEHLHAALLRGILHHAGMDSKRANYVASEINQLAVEKHVRFREGGLKDAYGAIHNRGAIDAVRDRMMTGGEYREAIHSIRPTSAAIPGASHFEVHNRLTGLLRRMYRG